MYSGRASQLLYQSIEFKCRWNGIVRLTRPQAGEVNVYIFSITSWTKQRHLQPACDVMAVCVLCSMPYSVLVVTFAFHIYFLNIEHENCAGTLFFAIPCLPTVQVTLSAQATNQPPTQRAFQSSIPSNFILRILHTPFHDCKVKLCVLRSRLP